MTRKRRVPPPSILSRDIHNGTLNIIDEDGIKGLIAELIASCEATDLFGVCSKMAYTLVFALLPTLLYIILVCSEFVDNFEDMFYSLIQVMLPETSVTYITTEIDRLIYYLNRVGPLLFILSMGAGTITAHTVLVGINQTYGFKRYKYKRYEWFKSFLILIVFVLSLALMTSFFLNAIEMASKITDTGISFTDAFRVDIILAEICLPVGLAVVLFFFYCLTPERRIKAKEAIPGTIFSTLGILIIFRIYVALLNHSQNYLRLYGSLSGLFVLLTAFYFMCVILNLGAKINVIYSYKINKSNYGKIKAE